MSERTIRHGVETVGKLGFDIVSPSSTEESADAIVVDIVHASEAGFTKAEYRKVLRKIDFILLPLMWIVSGTQLCDKNAIGTQATFGMPQDTHLHGQQLSWLSSIFYIAYLIGDTAIDVWANTRRDRLVVELGLSEAETLHQGRLNGESDMTDFENIHFRYTV